MVELQLAQRQYPRTQNVCSATAYENQCRRGAFGELRAAADLPVGVPAPLCGAGRYRITPGTGVDHLSEAAASAKG